MYDLPLFFYFLFFIFFEDSVYNGCHDKTMLTVNKRDFAIPTVKNIAVEKWLSW